MKCHIRPIRFEIRIRIVTHDSIRIRFERKRPIRTSLETRELPGERDNARNNARCSKATHGLDGQHQDVDRKSQSEWQRTGINGESTSMVWPTLGSRTAKEREQFNCVWDVVYYYNVLLINIVSLKWFGIANNRQAVWIGIVLAGYASMTAVNFAVTRI